MTRLGDDVVGRFHHGRRVVGTSTVPLVTQPVAAARGVQLKASGDNGGTVYVGLADVTAGSADATCGFPLEAGEGLFLPLDNAARVFAVADLPGQALHYCVW